MQYLLLSENKDSLSSVIASISQLLIFVYKRFLNFMNKSPVFPCFLLDF